MSPDFTPAPLPPDLSAPAPRPHEGLHARRRLFLFLLTSRRADRGCSASRAPRSWSTPYRAACTSLHAGFAGTAALVCLRSTALRSLAIIRPDPERLVRTSTVARRPGASAWWSARHRARVGHRLKDRVPCDRERCQERFVRLETRVHDRRYIVRSREDEDIAPK